MRGRSLPMCLAGGRCRRSCDNIAIQQDLGKGQVEIEIVAYGPGLGMLKLDSEVGGRVTEAIGEGVSVVACENTMANQKITRDDMLPKIGYVKAGVVEIMQKQQQGYAYVGP